MTAYKQKTFCWSTELRLYIWYCRQKEEQLPGTVIAGNDCYQEQHWTTPHIVLFGAVSVVGTGSHCSSHSSHAPAASSNPLTAKGTNLWPTILNSLVQYTIHINGYGISDQERTRIPVGVTRRQPVSRQRHVRLESGKVKCQKYLQVQAGTQERGDILLAFYHHHAFRLQEAQSTTLDTTDSLSLSFSVEPTTASHSLYTPSTRRPRIHDHILVLSRTPEKHESPFPPHFYSPIRWLQSCMYIDHICLDEQQWHLDKAASFSIVSC